MCACPTNLFAEQHRLHIEHINRACNRRAGGHLKIRMGRSRSIRGVHPGQADSGRSGSQKTLRRRRVLSDPITGDSRSASVGENGPNSDVLEQVHAKLSRYTDSVLPTLGGHSDGKAYSSDLRVRVIFALSKRSTAGSRLASGGPFRRRHRDRRCLAPALSYVRQVLQNGGAIAAAKRECLLG